ncbi:MAG: hypothetical protein H7336_05575 [Bacteriovorax sp.]|nr:hypothetical protein [Bacteriovorax sp.]
MKNFLVLGLAVFSLNAFACPNLSGSYVDKNGESIILSQKECEQVSVLSRPMTHTLTLDNEFTVVQDDADVTAQGRGIFQAEELVLEVKVVYKRDPGIPAIFLPVRAVNKYSQTVTGDLLEKSTIFNGRDGVLTNTKTTYKKVNQ